MSKRWMDVDWPMFLTNDAWAVNRTRYTREEAAALIDRECDGIGVDPAALTEGWMRYGFAPDDYGCGREACWHTCKPGRGAQPVWLLS
jgi:hypothetical protein